MFSKSHSLANRLSHDLNVDCCTNKDLVLAFQNIEGFNKLKLLEFNSFLANEKPHFFGVTEHWCSFEADIPHHPNYKVWGKCREDKRKGGVALWVRESDMGRSFDMPMPMSYDKGTLQEQLWVQIPTLGVAVAVVYNAPAILDVKMEQYALLEEFLSACKNMRLKPIIMGDFNVTESFNVDNNDEEALFLRNFVRVNDLVALEVQNGESFMRIPEGGRRFQRSSTIDYIFVPNNFENCTLMVDCEREISLPSDHVMLVGKCSVLNVTQKEEVHDERPCSVWSKKKLRNAQKLREFQDIMMEWSEEMD